VGRGHTSKIDVWAHKDVAKMRQEPHFRGNMKAKCPGFSSMVSPSFEDLLDGLGFGYLDPFFQDLRPTSRSNVSSRSSLD